MTKYPTRIHVHASSTIFFVFAALFAGAFTEEVAAAEPVGTEVFENMRREADEAIKREGAVLLPQRNSATYDQNHHLSNGLNGARALGNGGGYSGPEVSGEAVPTETEETYSEFAMDRATEICLKELAISIWNQVHESDFEKVVAATWPLQYVEGAEPIRWEDPEAYVTNVNQGSCEVEATVWGRPRYAKIQFSRCRPGPMKVIANPSAVSRSGFSSGPAAEFLLPSGVSFFSKNPQEGPKFVVSSVQEQQTLVRLNSGRETNFEINVGRHTQCLRTNVSNGLR